MLPFDYSSLSTWRFQIKCQDYNTNFSVDKIMPKKFFKKLSQQMAEITLPLKFNIKPRVCLLGVSDFTVQLSTDVNFN